jgi:aminoglycoside phosphotransferase (APT) family kinase protein
MDAPLAVGGSRLSWDELPAAVRAAVAAAAGAPVAAATSQPGGFSPGLAAVLSLAGGGSVFVKAVNAARNPDSPAMHRREAQVLAALPPAVPAPRLRWTYDDGDWVVLMTDTVDGTPPAQPWRPAELAVFLAAAAALADQLTPAPLGGGGAPQRGAGGNSLAAPTAQDYFRDDFTGWRRLAAHPERLDPWVRERLDRLVEIEAGWPDAVAGQTLLHGDLRADNVLLTARGAVVVDWPHACLGAGWLDLLLALPSIAMHGGGDPQRIWDAYPPARAADPDAVTAALAAAVGYFLWQAAQPEPANIPRVRAFQRAQGEAGLAWLLARLVG